MKKKEQVHRQRRCPRTKIQIPVHYKFMENGQQFHALESVSIDIAAKGLGAKCDRHLPEGQHLILNLYLPEEHNKQSEKTIYVEDECTPVLVLGELVWCEQMSDEDYYIGIKFHQVEDEHKRRFEAFLRAKNIYQYNAYYDPEY